MSAPKIRGDYEALSAIEKTFAKEAQDMRQVLQRLQSATEALRNGDWIGTGATAFYAEMDSAIFPAQQRLTQALSQAAQVTRNVSQLVKTAEDEAAQVFRTQPTAGAAALGEGGAAMPGGGGNGGGSGGGASAVMAEESGPAPAVAPAPSNGGAAGGTPATDPTAPTAATLPTAEQLTERLARAIGIWETNRGQDDPAPKESGLKTVAGLPASMATIEQATMPYAVDAFKRFESLRNAANPPLTLQEVKDAEARVIAVKNLVSSVSTASAAGTTPEDFIANNAAAITASGLSNENVTTMFQAATLKSTIDAANAEYVAETNPAKKAQILTNAIANIPEADRLGLNEGSLKAYIRNPKNWGENRAAWQRLAVNNMPNDVGARMEAVAESSNGTALAMPVIRSRVDAELAKTPTPSLEDVIKTVAQRNNPNETDYGKHVWETYDRLY